VRSPLTTARRAYEKNTRLSSAEIGKAIGRSRQSVDSYIADLRASTELEMDLKIFRMSRVDIPQERIALRLGQTRDIIRMHLGKMPVLAFSPNTDLLKGFTVPQVAEKHGWVEPLVWSIALEEKDDLHIIKKSGWQRTHIMQAPLSSERFNVGVVSAMQKKKILGVTNRYLLKFPQESST
jgi:hypothetical protein